MSPFVFFSERSFDSVLQTLLSSTLFRFSPIFCATAMVLSLFCVKAMLCALEMRTLLKIDPHVYTFGCPRVGCHVFSRVYSRFVDTSYRVVNQRDVVSTVPKFIRYALRLRFTHSLTLTHSLGVLVARFFLKVSLLCRLLKTRCLTIHSQLINPATKQHINRLPPGSQLSIRSYSRKVKFPFSLKSYSKLIDIT